MTAIAMDFLKNVVFIRIKRHSKREFKALSERFIEQFACQFINERMPAAPAALRAAPMHGARASAKDRTATASPFKRI
jgi:hypothetical protein